MVGVRMCTLLNSLIVLLYLFANDISERVKGSVQLAPAPVRSALNPEND